MKNSFVIPVARETLLHRSDDIKAVFRTDGFWVPTSNIHSISLLGYPRGLKFYMLKKIQLWCSLQNINDLSLCVPGTVNNVVIRSPEEDILESPSFLESFPSCHLSHPLSRLPSSPWFDSLPPNGAPFRPTLLSSTALAPLPQLSSKPY